MSNNELLDILVYLIKQEFQNHNRYCCKSDYGNEEFIQIMYKLIENYK
jgi:hypothetical protein